MLVSYIMTYIACVQCGVEYLCKPVLWSFKRYRYIFALPFLFRKLFLLFWLFTSSPESCPNINLSNIASYQLLVYNCMNGN